MKALNKEESEEIYQSADEEGKSKIEALDKACKILADAKVPFWIFAERPNEKAKDYYFIYQWCLSGKDFVSHHYEGLAWTFAEVFRNLAIEN